MHNALHQTTELQKMYSSQIGKTQLIRLREVMNRTKISRTSIYRLQGKGEFPQSIKIGRMVFWVESELHDYLDSKIKESQSWRMHSKSKSIQ